MFLPGFIFLAVAFILIIFVVWLWAIIDCLRSKLNTTEKLLWIIVIVFFHIIGALLYLIFSKTRGSAMKTKKFKGKKLLRSKDDRVIAGVCAGIANYLEVDPTLIRLLWVLFTLISFGTGILAYILAWIIIPEE